MRMLIAMLVWVLAGCGSVGAKQSDASIPFDSTNPEANAICTPTATFDTPVPLTGFNTTGNEGVPRLTADELELYFSGNVAGASDSNIYRALRSTTSQPFGAAMPLTQVNTASSEYDPSVSSDGLMLFFGSNRVSGEGRHLYVSTRKARIADFGAPAEAANVNSTTVTARGDSGPTISTTRSGRVPASRTLPRSRHSAQALRTGYLCSARTG